MSTLNGRQLRRSAELGLEVRALVTYPDDDPYAILMHFDPSEPLLIQYVEDIKLQLDRIADDELAIFVDDDAAVAIFGVGGVDYGS